MRRKRCGTFTGEMDRAGERASEGIRRQGLQFLLPFKSEGANRLTPKKRASNFLSNGYYSDALRNTQLTCASKKLQSPVWVSHYSLAWERWGIFFVYICPCQVSFKIFLWWQHLGKFLINPFESDINLIYGNTRNRHKCLQLQQSLCQPRRTCEINHLIRNM